MLTFDNNLEMPKETHSSFKTPITIFLKKGDYRFRLLKYTDPSKNDRKTPFIERHVHDHWGPNPSGTGKIPDDVVVCLKTQFVKHHGNRKNDCPMCRKADEAMAAWKASGFKDPVSAAKFNATKSKFQGIIPVYVISDPNNPKNNGECRCFMFTEKKLDRSNPKKVSPELNKPQYILTYDEFVSAIEAKVASIMSSGGGYTIWNGKNAVDLMIRVSEVPVQLKNGNTYVRKVITGLTFTKTPYDIDNITEKIENFQFDDQYYTGTSVEEIQNFLNRNYGTVVPNVPDEEISFDEPIEPISPTKNELSVSNPKQSVDSTIKNATDFDPADFNIENETNDLEEDPDNKIDNIEQENVGALIDELPDDPNF